MINFGVVGAGAFGSKRAKAIITCTGGRLAAVADKDDQCAKKVAGLLGVKSMGVDDILAAPEIDALIVAVPNRFHSQVAVAALQNGKHVLVEKPLARTVAEAQRMVEAAESSGSLLKTGSNHRWFSSVRKARQLVDEGQIGKPFSFLGRIGTNGERIQNTWFWDREMSGGGTLLDNGCHLLDLARWFLGDFVSACGATANTYWKSCPVEDTASGVFLTQEGCMATINSSWRQLSGYFYFELNGEDGYIAVDGRFDAHGGDMLYWRSRKDRGEIHAVDFGHVPPSSYQLELEDFIRCIRANRVPEPSGRDGLEVIRMVEAIYASNNCLLTF